MAFFSLCKCLSITFLLSFQWFLLISNGVCWHSNLLPPFSADIEPVFVNKEEGCQAGPCCVCLLSRVWGKCSTGGNVSLSSCCCFGELEQLEKNLHVKTSVSLSPTTISFPAVPGPFSAGQQLCPATDSAVGGATVAALTWLWAVFVLRWDGGRAAAKMGSDSVLPPDV